MRILSIESSCDETGASVVERNDDKITVLSNKLATSSNMHAITGGIIPENAAREQIKAIIPVIVRTLLESQNIESKESQNPDSWNKARQILKNEIDAIAITYGPGLIGSLIVGVETTKTLCYVLDKPLIPVNHLLAHIYANFIDKNKDEIKFPFVGLIVSGGHTDLLYFKSHTDYKWLGGTRDDAAGEAIDKIGRMLDLPYPAGPEMEKRASRVTNPQVKFQSPMIGSNDYDFSFSGLKAETMRFVKSNEMNDDLKNQICFATQKAVFDVLVKKTLNAAAEYNCNTILIGGGVSANQTLLESFKKSVISNKSSVEIFSPEKIYATDNAAMIGAYALMNGETKPWKEIRSNPELYFS